MAKVGYNPSTLKVLYNATTQKVKTQCCNSCFGEDSCCYLPPYDEWDSGTTYAKDDIVKAYDNYLAPHRWRAFKSLQGNNTNKNPPANGSWWERVSNTAPCGNDDWDMFYPPFGGLGKTPTYYTITFHDVAQCPSMPSISGLNGTHRLKLRTEAEMGEFSVPVDYENVDGQLSCYSGWYYNGTTNQGITLWLGKFVRIHAGYEFSNSYGVIWNYFSAYRRYLDGCSMFALNEPNDIVGFCGGIMIYRGDGGYCTAYPSGAGCDDAVAWVIGSSYPTAQKVTGNGGVCYISYVGHISSASNRPPSGGNWTTYWYEVDG